jgi:flagellin-like protein
VGLRDRLKVGSVKKKTIEMGHEIDKGVSIKKLRVRTRVHENRGVSPIISSIILTAMVLAIGAGVWGVATGASTVVQNNYHDEVMESVEKIKERFCIENVGVDGASNTLMIWIYNYGSIDLVVERIRVQGSSTLSYHSFNVTIPVGQFERVDVTPSEISLVSGMSVSIEVRSSRGNKAYDSILVP